VNPRTRVAVVFLGAAFVVALLAFATWLLSPPGRGASVMFAIAAIVLIVAALPYVRRP
jgi:hypothetical protein